MIVEIFEKGTNFKNHVTTEWGVTNIFHDNGNYILGTEDDPIVVSSKDYELRISY